MRTQLKLMMVVLAVALIPAAASAQPVKIGALFGVTGPIANFIPPIIDGANLAVKEINDNGGILGGLQIVPYYDRTELVDSALWTVGKVLIEGIFLVVVEGFLYSGGALMLGARWPDLSPQVFGYHEVWHTLVTAAVAVHFVLVAIILG